MATHSIILAWKIPWTEEPGGAIVHEVSRVEHDLATKPPEGEAEVHCVSPSPLQK